MAVDYWSFKYSSYGENAKISSQAGDIWTESTDLLDLPLKLETEEKTGVLLLLLLFLLSLPSLFQF